MRGEGSRYGAGSHRKEVIRMRRTLLLLILLSLVILPSAAWTPRNKTDANDTHAALNTTWMTNVTESISFNSTGFTDFFGAITLPFTTAMGALFYVFIYILPLAVIWIRQEKALLPVGLAVILGGIMLSQLPVSWQLPAQLFIILTIFGLVYGMFKERG